MSAIRTSLILVTLLYVVALFRRGVRGFLNELQITEG